MWIKKNLQPCFYKFIFQNKICNVWLSDISSIAYRYRLKISKHKSHHRFFWVETFETRYRFNALLQLYILQQTVLNLISQYYSYQSFHSFGGVYSFSIRFHFEIKFDVFASRVSSSNQCLNHQLSTIYQKKKSIHFMSWFSWSILLCAV